MKILITGGSGFIGCYFANALQQQDHQCVALDLYPFDRQIDDVELILGDIRDSQALDCAMSDCQAVLHLAAAHHDFGITDDTFESVNVTGTQKICDAMDRHQVKDICFYSTVAVFGSAAPPHDEFNEPQPESPYGKTKLRAEQALEKWTVKGDDRKCLVIRPTVTFGPYNFANMYTLISQIDRGLFVPVGQGDNIKSLSYIENIVDATLQTWQRTNSQREAFEVFNYVCKPDLTSAEIASCVYEALGKRQPKLHIPYWLARALALPADLVIATTGKNLPISGMRIKKLAKSQTKYESQKIRDAGFQQRVSIRDGISKMVDWYLRECKSQENQAVIRRLPPPDPQPLTNYPSRPMSSPA